MAGRQVGVFEAASLFALLAADQNGFADRETRLVAGIQSVIPAWYQVTGEGPVRLDMGDALASAILQIATDFCALQRKKSCAINRHNQQLFDDLGGAKQYRWGYGKAERLGGLEIYDHLEFCRKLHREIARLLAAQNAIDIGGGTRMRRFILR